MAVQDEFPTMELVIRRHYKTHDHWGLNQQENSDEDNENKAAQNQHGQKKMKMAQAQFMMT